MREGLSLHQRAQGAMLGVAIGDALGWPQEQNARNIDRGAPTPIASFRKWRRRTGGRYQPYEDLIDAGEYSDDTQLTLCGARSLLYGNDWFLYLTNVELPLWMTYERGGGRSVLRAAAAWASGHPPWVPRRNYDPAPYFATGANGVAMRVLPHAILSASDSSFREVAKRVVHDGCTTHGHSAALVGGLLHAFTLWSALRLTSTLRYGELLLRLREEGDSWAIFDRGLFPESWLDARDALPGTAIDEEWSATVEETLGYLDTAIGGVESGPLATEEDVLSALGVHDKKVNGSGTISSVSAAFLASRAAASPSAGLVSAAFLRNADTDTLASMTASILGAVNGVDWMGGLAREVQDHEYIRRVAEHLLAAPADGRGGAQRLTKSAVDRWVNRLGSSAEGTKIELPDGRTAVIGPIEVLLSKSANTSVWRRTLETDDGQTIFVTKVSRAGQQERKRPDGAGSEPPKPAQITRIGFKIEVSDLAPSRAFYESVIGLRATRAGGTYVTYGHVLALTARENPSTPQLDLARPRFTVHLECTDVSAVFDAVTRSGARVMEELHELRGRSRFTCVDPDGNTIEIVAPDGGPGTELDG